MRSKLPFLALLGTFVLHISCLTASAQPSDDIISGSIQLEQGEARKDPYQENQDGSIEFFTTLEKNMREMAAGTAKIEKTRELTRGELLHLNATYLYCESIKGTCPTVLDAILESDVLNARVDGKAQCNNMRQFWKSWTKTDMQKREGYMIKIGHTKRHQDFRRKRLPAYVRCKDTVKDYIALEEEMTNEAFVKERYGDGSIARDKIIKAIALLKQIKKKRVNVLRAVGVK